MTELSSLPKLICNLQWLYLFSSVRLKVVEGQLVRVIAARTAVIRFCK